VTASWQPDHPACTAAYSVRKVANYIMVHAHVTAQHISSTAVRCLAMGQGVCAYFSATKVLLLSTAPAALHNQCGADQQAESELRKCTQRTEKWHPAYGTPPQHHSNSSKCTATAHITGMGCHVVCCGAEPGHLRLPLLIHSSWCMLLLHFLFLLLLLLLRLILLLPCRL
jgi:hypothetical protein